MNELFLIAKLLILVGIILIGVGALLFLAPKLPFLGRLPGDIYFKKENVTFFFPLTTCIIISIILTIIFYLIEKLR